MGYRNPITSVAAVDTGTNPLGARVRVYEGSDPDGSVYGVVEWDDGIFGDTPAKIIGRSTPNPRGLSGSVGGSLTISAGTYNGKAGPTLGMNVVQNGDGSYSSVAELDADTVNANGSPVNFPRALGDVIGNTDPTAGSTNVVIGSITATVPSGLPAGSKIKVTGTCYVVTPTGVGAVLTVGGNSRAINQGSMVGDVTVVYYDTNLTAGSRTWQMQLHSTVAGQTVTGRRPAMQVDIL